MMMVAAVHSLQPRHLVLQVVGVFVDLRRCDLFHDRTVYGYR
jgi:hypothetical protein